MGNTDDDDHRKKPKPVEDNSHAAVRKLPRRSQETPSPQSAKLPRRSQVLSLAAVNCFLPRRCQDIPTLQSTHQSVLPRRSPSIEVPLLNREEVEDPTPQSKHIPRSPIPLPSPSPSSP